MSAHLLAGNLGARGACLALGVLAALGLAQGMREPLRWLPKDKPVPVRVSVRAAVPSQAGKTREPVAAPAPAPAVVDKPAPEPARTPAPKPAPARAVKPRAVLPLQGEMPTPREEPRVAPAQAPVEPTAPVLAQTHADSAPLGGNELMTLSQPAVIAAPTPAVPLLPPVPGADIPPMPGSELPAVAELPTSPPESAGEEMPERPYGPVLVLEVRINDQGQVIDSRILVPSSNAMGDLAMALAIKGQRYTQLTPPMYPGEIRRLELRIPYAQQENTNPDGTSALP